jgi:hypothetical protein
MKELQSAASGRNSIFVEWSVHITSNAEEMLTRKYAQAVTSHTSWLIFTDFPLSHCHVFAALIFQVLDRFFKYLTVSARDNIWHIENKTLLE